MEKIIKILESNGIVVKDRKIKKSDVAVAKSLIRSAVVAMEVRAIAAGGDLEIVMGECPAEISELKKFMVHLDGVSLQEFKAIKLGSPIQISAPSRSNTLTVCHHHGDVSVGIRDFTGNTTIHKTFGAFKKADQSSDYPSIDWDKYEEGQKVYEVWFPKNSREYIQTTTAPSPERALANLVYSQKRSIGYHDDDYFPDATGSFRNYKKLLKTLYAIKDWGFKVAT